MQVRSGSVSPTMNRTSRSKSVPPAAEPLYRLGNWLRQEGYAFVTVTPVTHARVLARNPAREARSLEDIFGWNLPFRAGTLPAEALTLLREADAVEENPGLPRSRVRFSTLEELIFVHSGYPTQKTDAVFFGPDTYRFAALIERALLQFDTDSLHTIADIGCGSGAGGIVARRLLDAQAPQLILSDINPLALRYAAVNALLAGLEPTILRQGDLYAHVGAPLDLIVANPPYLVDGHGRTYRHGGGMLGAELSRRIVLEGLPRLGANGILVLYTASAIVNGHDTFRETVRDALDHPDIEHEYREIDPDVFGEELENPAYADVDRIAAVSLVIQIRHPIARGSEARSRTHAPEVPALLSA
jgi:methylase of polypeptide subunit release factors